MGWESFNRHLPYLSDSDRSRVRLAFDMGAKAHDGQKRKSGEPYFTHPIAIAERLAAMGADGDTLIAALLHDTVEDTPLTLDEIEAAFGPVVRGLIDGVTKLTAADLTSPSHDEQIETLRKMFTLMQGDVRIMVVKIVDRWHNMTTVMGLSPERRKSFAQETLDIVVKIADRLSMKELRDELTAQSMAVLEPELFAELETLRKEFSALATDVVAAMEKKLRPNLPKGVRIYSRRLSLEKTRVIHDLGSGSGKAEMTAIFVCPDTAACYEVLGQIHQAWPLQRLTFDDYINTPSVNGYRGIHTTVILPNGRRVRCKIRTEAMDEYDRLGIAMYCFRHAGDGTEVAQLPWTERISPLAEGTSYQSEAFWTSLQRDLLGEEIVVYGSSEQSVTIPSGSTALDAAFYLFNEQAIHVSSLRVNGQAVALDAPLANGDTVDVSFSDAVEAGREWLNYVESGLASTLIRQELAKAPEQEKILLGRTMLDLGLRRHNLPGLGELQPQVFREGLATLGLGDLGELYVQLAEGKLTVPQALNFFSPALGGRMNTAKLWDLSLTVDNEHEAGRWLSWVRSFHPLRLVERLRSSGRGRLTASLSLTQTEADSMDAHLRSRLTGDRWWLRPRRQQLTLIATAAVLVILWGLDPVLGQLLIENVVSVPMLTLVRFAAFIAVALIAQAAMMRANPGRLMPISPLSPPIFGSGIALFVTTVGTYASLRTINPTSYILMIVAGVLALTCGRGLLRRENVWAPATCLAIAIVSLVATFSIDAPSWFGVAAAILGSGGFAAYSLASQEYQKTVSIRTRYPSFLLWAAVVAMACSLTLVPWVPVGPLDPAGITLATLYVLVFTVLPYILFFEIMRMTQSRLLERLLPLVIVSTVLGDLVLHQNGLPLLALPALCAVTWLLWRHAGGTDE